MKVFNTASRTIEDFTPLNPPLVTLYTCGQTVYDYTHIGHGRTYVNDDILRRTLEFNGFQVKHVQNVTDVGHLVSDADEGEDKLEKGAKKSGKTVWEVAKYFTDDFYTSLDKLNIIRPTIICKATEHIPEQIELIKTLIQKGHAYETSSGIFFSIDTFPKYDNLFGQHLEDKKTGARKDVVIDPEKKNPADFALWFKAVGRFANHAMQWDSPWGKGFPGWHIECSAMSMHYLGPTIDIHTGGIDHISVHHPNEIAQSESATGKQFVRYWMHMAHLMVDGAKMSKSLNNFYRIDDVQKKGYDPLALRYLYLLTHYRKELNFTWESLESASLALAKLRTLVYDLKQNNSRTVLSSEKLDRVDELRNEFKLALENDLNIPEGIATMWKVAKSNIPSEDKYDLIQEFDQVLGLNLLTYVPVKLSIPEEILKLQTAREQAKKDKNYILADEIRKNIEDKGFILQDGPHNSIIIPKK